MKRLIGFALIVMLLSLGGCDCNGGEDGPVDGGGDTLDTVSDVADDVSDPDGVEDSDAVVDDANDAQPDDAQDGDDVGQTGAASLTVRVDGEATEGAEVIAHAPNGTLAAQVTTDGSGRAEFEVEPGGMVTLVTSSEMSTVFPDYYTVTDVQPGDSILLEFGAGTVKNIGSVDIEMPGAFGEAVTADWVAIGCAAATDVFTRQTLSLAVNSSCPNDGQTVNVLALIGGFGEPVAAYSTMSNVSVDPTGGTVVTLPDWQTNTNSYALTVEDIPSGFTVRAEMQLRLAGLRYENSLRSVGAGSESRSFAFEYPPSFSEGTRHSVLLQKRINSTSSSIGLAETDGGSASDKSFTVSATDMLPALDSKEVVDTSTARPTIQWSTSPNGAGGDTIDSSDGGMVQHSWGSPARVWRVVVAPGRTEVTLPELPSGVPDPSTGSADFTTVGFIDLSDTEGYREFRQEPPTDTNLGGVLRESEYGAVRFTYAR